MNKNIFPRSICLRTIFSAAAVALLLLALSAIPLRAQGISGVDRERALVMLGEIRDSIKKDYYDPTYHGVDIEARFSEAQEMVKKATTLGQAFGIIAQAVMSLNDSHTFFLPPAQTVTADYGWQMAAIGNICYVTAVKPGSDAEAKGLKPGDAILTINGVLPTREDLWKLTYLYYALRPSPGMRLLVQSPDGKRRELDAMAKVETSKRKLDLSDDGSSDLDNLIRDSQSEDQLHRHRYYEMTDVFIWKMPQFDLGDQGVDELMDKARKHSSMILDLRGNSGGSESTMLRMIGNLFDKDVPLGMLKRRKETKPIMAKTIGAKAFKGKVIVLVDSESGSAAEIFARVMQLEKRGTVIGDKTAGAVMRARRHSYQMGRDIAVFYGASITDADFLMTDGASLEHAGVTPDTIMLPTGLDLSKSLDPVMLYAAGLVDLKLTPEKAGSLFPIEWRK